MPTLQVDGSSLHYAEQGSGPLLLLLHGSPGAGSAWARVAEPLAERFRVVMPDLPGHGGSDPVSPTGELEPVSRIVEALIEQVGRPTVLAGHSYGGVVALSVALRRQAPVGALALFEPVALKTLLMVGEQETFEGARQVFDAYIADFEGGNPQAIRAMVDFWFGEGAFEAMPEPIAQHLVVQTAVNVCDVKAVFREQYDAAAFAALRMPVTTVVGERSPSVTRRIAEAITGDAMRREVVLLPKATHAMTSTHAPAVARIIAAMAGVSLDDPVRGE